MDIATQRDSFAFLEEMRSFERGVGGISFVPGSPGAETLKSCTDMMLNASQSLLTKDVNVDSLFRYGPAAGESNFLQHLSEFLSQEYGDSINCSDMIETAGATQGLHLILSLLCHRDSPVFVEDPGYFYGFRMIRDDLQMNIVPVPSDKDGIDTAALDKLMNQYKKSHARLELPTNRYWAAVYLVPVFGNPTGWTYSTDCCKKLVQLARKHDVLLIAEDVYNLLYFTGKPHPPPRLISFDKKTDQDYGKGHVLSNGSFSKILAPSLRLGWIEGPTNVISLVAQSNLANSGGSFNHYTSMLVSSILKSGVLSQHVQFLRQVYKDRLETLSAVLDKHLPEDCFYHKPEGGFFLWLNLRKDIDTFEFVRFAKSKHDVTFLPGICSSPTRAFQNCARLSISSNNKELIYEGAVRLCQAYKDFIGDIKKL